MRTREVAALRRGRGRPPLRARRWLWLFPATYLVHIAEEGLAGERFYRWVARVSGRSMSGRAFLGLNALYWTVMALAVRGAVRGRERRPWIAPALGTVVALNAVGHVLGSALSCSYSPGLVSGLLLWGPLGVVALASSGSRQRLQCGVLAGLAMQVGVVLGAAAAMRRPAVRPALGADRNGRSSGGRDPGWDG
jgi:Protein of unknown function with HXXEE motif